MVPPSSWPPPPPQDFAARELPVETVPVGTHLSRIHLVAYDPIHFGSNVYNRFDNRNGDYGVCYMAMSPEGAFAETFLRSIDTRVIFRDFVRKRSISELEVIYPLRLLSLHGPGLARVGANGAVASGPHGVAQLWSREIHDHPEAPDGIVYRSKHDDDELCIALFDRARDFLVPASAPRPMDMDRSKLIELCYRYGLGLE